MDKSKPMHKAEGRPLGRGLPALGRANTHSRAFGGASPPPSVAPRALKCGRGRGKPLPLPISAKWPPIPTLRTEVREDEGKPSSSPFFCAKWLPTTARSPSLRDSLPQGTTILPARWRLALTGLLKQIAHGAGSRGPTGCERASRPPEGTPLHGRQATGYAPRGRAPPHG